MSDVKYLNEVMNKKIPVKMFLSTGTMLQGLITNFNENYITIDQCLVNKDFLVSIDHK